jgi:hypothetical protein
MVGKGLPLPRIAQARIVSGRTIEVSWKDGRSSVVDLTPALSRRKSFKSILVDEALFATLQVDDFGDAVIWADGAALAAVWIEELVVAEQIDCALKQPGK